MKMIPDDIDNAFIRKIDRRSNENDPVFQAQINFFIGRFFLYFDEKALLMYMDGFHKNHLERKNKMTKNTTISEVFMQSLKNAYGSKNNFEKEFVYKAYQYGNKGRFYFALNQFLNFIMYPSSMKDEYASSYPLLECNLDTCDIFNFIEDIDYTRLSNAYLKVRSMIES